MHFRSCAPTGSRAGSGACAGSRASPSAGTQAAAHRAAARGRPARKAECKADLLACAASAFTQLCASAPLYDAVYSHHTGADPAGASRTAANLACGSAGSFAADRCCSRSAAHTANRRCSSSCSAARCTKGFSHTDGFSHAVLAGVTQPHGSWREIQPLLPQTDFNQHKTPPGPRQVPEAFLAFGIPSLRHLNILPSFPSAFATQCIPRCARPLAVE